MLMDVRRNPALLKLDLYCRGMRLDDSCLVEDDGGRRVMRTRAGLGSGLEVVLPGGLWTNVPVAEPFAQASPYLLIRDAGTLLDHARPRARRAGARCRRAPPGTTARRPPASA